MANSLRIAMGASDTALFLNNDSEFPTNGGTVMVDSEIMQYVHSADTSLLTLTRGVQGTSAATHSLGAVVTLLESYPFAPSLLPYNVLVLTSLLDPTAVPTAATIEGCNVLLINFDSSGSNQTWTLPPMAAGARRLLMLHKSGSAKSLSVNSVSIAAGTGQEFAYDGSAWYAV